MSRWARIAMPSVQSDASKDVLPRTQGSYPASVQNEICIGSGMAVYNITIPKWHPTTVNRLLNCHWAVAGKRKSIDRKMICYECKRHRVPRTEGRRRVSLIIHLDPGQRGADVDAYWKSILDALVHAGAICNDSHRWSELGLVRFMRDGMGTTITLEDIP